MISGNSFRMRAYNSQRKTDYPYKAKRENYEVTFHVFVDGT